MGLGIAKFDGKCKRCNGEIKAGITKIRWAPSIKGSQTHDACYYDSTPKYRNMLGEVIGDNGVPIPNPIPDIPDNTPDNDDEPEPKPKPLETKPATPAAPGGGDLVAMIASAVLPLVKSQLDTKVDANEVKRIAETAVLDCADILRNEFTTKIIIEDKAKGEIKELGGLQHNQFTDLLALVQAGMNVFLFDSNTAGKLGGPGAGKTTACAQVADALGKKFYHISLNIQSQPSLIMGYKTASGEYVQADFRRCYESGGVFLFDEFDNANGNFVTSMNTALANGSCSFPDGIVARHPDSVFLAAGNTPGTGASALHNSRQLLDAASRERFVFLAWQYDEKLERKAALAHNADAEPWVSFVQNVRKHIQRLGVKLVCSPRASIMGAQLLKTASFKVEQIADMVLFKGIDADTRSKVLANQPLPNM